MSGALPPYPCRPCLCFLFYPLLIQTNAVLCNQYSSGTPRLSAGWLVGWLVTGSLLGGGGTSRQR